MMYEAMATKRTCSVRVSAHDTHEDVYFVLAIEERTHEPDNLCERGVPCGRCDAHELKGRKETAAISLHHFSQG